MIKLPALPPSDDKFWDGAKKELLGPNVGKCNHYFISMGNEAECKYCQIGFFLGPNETVEEGKIYHKKQLVI